MDTVCFIYFMEEHEVYHPVIRPLMVAVHEGELELVTSAITLLEVLVLPYRAGDLSLADRYEVILTNTRSLTLVEIDRDQLRTAAALRAQYSGLRTPDALQLAAALTTGCTAFVTNDRGLPGVAGLKVVQIDDHL